MARFCCDWCAGSIERRDFRQDHGGGPDALPHRKKKGKAKPRPRKKPGCPGNEGKSHIYIWVKTVYLDGKWTNSGEPYTEYGRECLGCKRAGDRRWRYVPDESEIYETRTYTSYWDSPRWW